MQNPGTSQAGKRRNRNRDRQEKRTLAVKLKNINTGKQNSDKVLFELGECGALSSYEPDVVGNLLGNIPGEEFKLAEPLTFPETELEGSELHAPRSAVKFQGSITIKLTNGEALAARH